MNIFSVFLFFALLRMFDRRKCDSDPISGRFPAVFLQSPRTNWTEGPAADLWRQAAELQRPPDVGRQRRPQGDAAPAWGSQTLSRKDF